MSPARIDVGTRLHATTREVEAPGELLDHLGTDGFAWFGEDVSFVTGGVVAAVSATEAASLLAAIGHDAPAGAPAVAGPVATGALGFEGTGRLVVPARICTVDADGHAWSTTIDHGISTRRDAPPAPSGYTVDATSFRDAWARGVERVLRAIEAGELEKVVLARAVDVEADVPFAVERVLAQLRRTQPGCFVFAADGFVGATPELLVRRRGDQVTCRPMAGTVPRDVDDARSAAELLASRKNGNEHDVVATAVVAELSRWCDGVTASGPEVAPFADVAHLVTHIGGRVRDDATSALDLACALHPTPAVAGTPRDAALAMIRAIEPHERGKYAGPVGWVAPNGDGEFAVALRCAAIDGCHATLHAGAGIVAGSDAALEWEETSAKFEPMLRALVRP
jgi:menaquinone-specific isochorismate synthase